MGFFVVVVLEVVLGKIWNRVSVGQILICTKINVVSFLF